MAGPYFAYGIGGSYTFKSALSTVEDGINFGSGTEDDLKPFDIGLNFGGGVELSHFQLAVQYGLGLTNLAPVTDNDAEQKNKVITISLAYLFGVKIISCYGPVPHALRPAPCALHQFHILYYVTYPPSSIFSVSSNLSAETSFVFTLK